MEWISYWILDLHWCIYPNLQKYYKLCFGSGCAKLECDCDKLTLDTVPEKSQNWIRVSYLIKMDLMSPLERIEKELASVVSWNRWTYLSICVLQELQTKLPDINKIIQTNRGSEYSLLRYGLYYILGSLLHKVIRDVDFDQRVDVDVERLDEIRRR